MPATKQTVPNDDVNQMVHRFVTELEGAFRRRFLRRLTAVSEGDLLVEITAERTAKNPKFPAMVATAAAKPKAKAKRHIQMCPVPRCKERAAPVFNMVCAKHKGLPKATIKKYREQRRAAAAKAAKSGKKP